MFWNVVNMSDTYLWSVSRCWPSEAAEVTLSVNRNREYSTSWMWENTIKLGRIARTVRMTMKHYDMCLSQSRQKNTIAKNQQHRTSRSSTLWIASKDSSSGSARSYRCGPCSKAFLFTQSFCQRRKRSDAEKLSRQGYHWLKPETSKYIRIVKHQASNIKNHQIKLLNSQVFNLNAITSAIMACTKRIRISVPSFRMFQVKSPAEKHHISLVWWKYATRAPQKRHACALRVRCIWYNFNMFQHVSVRTEIC